MIIKNKRQLQKIVMLNSNGKWWEVNELTSLMRDECEIHGLKSINHESVSRNIRHFREPEHALRVEKRLRAGCENTWEFKITPWKIP